MRDLINLIQNLSEDNTLNPGVILRRAGRFESFIQMIRNQTPFYTVDQEPVIAKVSEADRMQELFDAGKFSGIIKLETDQGVFPLSRLLKTKELGGQASTGEEGEELSKEAALVKPSQIGITDIDIPANQLGKIIVNNDILRSTEYGRAIIDMAKAIMNGQPAIVPQELRKTKIGSSINDYAGEYLGVLAMIYGQSDFPRRDGFVEWLGADVSDLTLFFPIEANSPLADSFASISNDKTNHKVNISSKGVGGGAPPSLSGLKISDEIRENPDYAAAVALIDLADAGDSKKDIPPKYPLPSPRTISIVFQAMNLINEYVPNAIPKEFIEFLPWKADIVKQCKDSIEGFKRGNHIEMPKYESITSKVKSDKASDGGKLVYVVKEAVLKAVNEKSAIPGFREVVLTILDMNFVQQYATYNKKTGLMTFATQWPAKHEGYVTLQSKSGATDPTKGGFSFKVSPDKPKTDLPKPDETVAPSTGAGSEIDYDDETRQKIKSKKITSIFRPDEEEKKKPDKSSGAGRGRRNNLTKN
jgi:hypothetical protein